VKRESTTIAGHAGMDEKGLIQFLKKGGRIREETEGCGGGIINPGIRMPGYFADRSNNLKANPSSEQ
jgi:hypothetical protein